MAISSASYARGNPVYKGGSNAPTRGTVDPMGYIDRSLNNPSQSRSGLAQAALSKLSAPKASPAQSVMDFAKANGQTVGYANPTAPMQHQVTPTGQLIPAPYAAQPTASVRPDAPPSPITANQGMDERGPQPTGLAPQVSAPPPMPATAPNPVSSPTAMPFDFTAAAGEALANAQRNAHHNVNQQKLQGLEQNYINQTRDAQLEHPNDLRGILNQYAGRGLAHSSGYGYAVGQNEDHFATLLSRLGMQHTQDVNGINSDDSNYDAQYAAQLQGLKAAAAERLAGQAGSIGLADPSSDPVNPDVPNTTPTGDSGLPWTKGPEGVGTRPAPMHDQLHWEGAIDPASRAALAAGKTVIRGNGYQYKMSGPNGTGVPIRVA